MTTLPRAAIERIDALLRDGGRKILGIVGAPGAGKSTLAAMLQREYGSVAQVVPMDGFHLAQSELDRLGRAHRKGAPDTFDAAGCVALLRRLAHPAPDEIVYAPEFRREIEEPIAGAIGVAPATRLVITEGNYLLLREGAWAHIEALLDDSWYLHVDQDVRVARLVERHRRHGRSEQQAADWVARTDEPNARLIEACQPRARFVFGWQL